MRVINPRRKRIDGSEIVGILTPRLLGEVSGGVSVGVLFSVSVCMSKAVTHDVK